MRTERAEHEDSLVRRLVRVSGVFRELMSDMYDIARAHPVNEMVAIPIERNDDRVRPKERAQNDSAHQAAAYATDAERREVGHLWQLVQRDHGAASTETSGERRHHRRHRRWARAEHREPEVEPDDVGVGPRDGAIERHPDVGAVPLPHAEDLDAPIRLALGGAASAVRENSHLLDAPVAREFLDEERAVVGDARDRRWERGDRADPHSSRVPGARRPAATIRARTTMLAMSATRLSSAESTLTGGEPRDSYKARTDGTNANAVTHASAIPSATAGAARSQAAPRSLNLGCKWRDRLHHDR